MPTFAPHKSLVQFIRREPALAALLAGCFLLNVYAFSFPTWNPDYLVRYAWNARGLAEWNHGAFYYGSFHINVIKMLIIWPLLAINWVWPVMTAATVTPQTMALYLARWLAAAMGAGCAGWTWGIARRLAGRRVAAFAAAFGVATTPLMINLAHFTTADVPSLFWALGGLYFLLRHAEDPARRRWWILSAVCIGLTTSTKYVGALFGAGAVAWLAVEVAARRMTPAAALRQLAVFAAVSLGVFALGSFEMWFFPATVRENIMLNVNINRQLAGQMQIGFLAIPHHLPRATGWLWIALAGVGVAAALARREARGPAIVILAALAANYLFFGSAHYFPFRYALPFLPLLLIFSGAAVGWGLDGLRGAKSKLPVFVIAAFLLAGLAVLMTLRAAAVSHQFAADTRLRAAGWLAENLAPGDLIAFNEDWFLYFPALPATAQPFDLTERPPEGWRVGDALAASNVRWVMTSSLVQPGSQKEWEREFYAALARGDAPYRPAAEFKIEKSWLHDPRTVEFLNPHIRVFELNRE